MVLMGILTLVMSVLTFVLMGMDKKRARSNAWRVPERLLFLVAALMGGIGGTAGMLNYRHKTKHWYFKLGFPALALAQTALLVWLSIIMR